MAKKSNKTEQVLKLITKENEEPGDSDKPVVLDAELPSGSEGSTEPAEPVEAVETAVTAEPVEAAEPVAPAVSVEPAAPAAPAEAPVPLSAARGTVQVDQVHLINLTERLVREKAKEVMDRLNVCDCSICVQDILALTLNSLPNKFITTDSGRQHLQLEIYKKQYETDIIAALTRASVRVKASPRHGE